MSHFWYLIVNLSSFVLGIGLTIRNCLPAHRDYQKFRREHDGYAPPWWMCWVYWVGLDEKLLRHKMSGQVPEGGEGHVMFGLPIPPLVPIQWCDCGCRRCLAECHYQCETGVHIPFRTGPSLAGRVPTEETKPLSDWPPRSEDGLHGATYEWDGPHTAVRCICGFYCITENLDMAEREYIDHIETGRMETSEPHS